MALTAVEVLEDVRQTRGERGGRDARGDPVVEREGRELALEDGRSAEVDARRRDVAREHLQGVLEEVEVVGLALGDGDRERVAVAAARAADALEVVGLGGRDRGEEDRREVADVDAHLERRRAREEVGGPGAVVADESLLQGLAVVALQEARVLAGDDAVEVAVGVEAGVVVAAGRGRRRSAPWHDARRQGGRPSRRVRPRARRPGGRRCRSGDGLRRARGRGRRGGGPRRARGRPPVTSALT